MDDWGGLFFEIVARYKTDTDGLIKQINEDGKRAVQAFEKSTQGIFTKMMRDAKQAGTATKTLAKELEKVVAMEQRKQVKSTATGKVFDDTNLKRSLELLSLVNVQLEQEQRNENRLREIRDVNAKQQQDYLRLQKSIQAEQARQQNMFGGGSSSNMVSGFKLVSSAADQLNAKVNNTFNRLIYYAEQYKIPLNDIIRKYQQMANVEITKAINTVASGGSFDPTKLNEIFGVLEKLKAKKLELVPEEDVQRASKLSRILYGLFGNTKLGRIASDAFRGFETIEGSLAGATKGATGLVGVLGKIAIPIAAAVVVATALLKIFEQIFRLVARTIKQFTEMGFELNKNVEIMRLSLTGMFGDLESANAFIADMQALGAKMGTSFEETVDSARRLLPYAQGNVETFNKLMTMAQQLNLSNPAVDLGQSALAVIETINGDLMRMFRTFNLNTDAIRVWHQEFQRTGDLDAYITKVQDYLGSLGFSVDLVEQYGNTFKGAMATATMYINRMAVAFTQPMMDVLTEQLQVFIKYIEDNETEIISFFIRLGAVIAASIEKVIELAKETIEWFDQMDERIIYNRAAEMSTRTGLGIDYYIEQYTAEREARLGARAERRESTPFNERVEEIYNRVADVLLTNGEWTPPTGFSLDQDELSNMIAMAKELEDALKDYQDEVYELQIEHRDKIQEIIDDAAKERIDAYEDYLKDLADVEEEYQEDLEDSKEEYNDKIEDIEQDHVDRLLEIRQKYMDQLFDAVNARDARRVFEIMRDMNRELADENQQADKKRKEAQKDYQEELEDLKEARDERLEELRESYLEELADIAEKEAEALADEQKSYEKRQAELKRALEKKIEEIARKNAQEQLITEQNLRVLEGLYRNTFGANGVILNMMDSYLNELAVMAAREQAILAGMGGVTGGSGGSGIPLPEGGTGTVPGGVPVAPQKPTTAQTQAIASKLYALDQSLGSFYAVEAANDALHHGNTGKLKSYKLWDSIMGVVTTFLAQQNYMQAYSALSSGLNSMIASNLGSYVPGGSIRPMAGGLDVVVTRPTLFQAGEGGPERVMGIPLGARSALSKNTGTSTTIVHKIDGNGISKEMEALIAYQIGRATGQAVVGYTRSRRR